jgi:hypothetical protein
MPAKPTWFLRVPQIIADLNLVETPVVDRAVLQKVFGLGRRQAIMLMHRFGGYQAGKTFLLDRMELIESIRRLHDHDDFGRERRRKQRLGSALDELRRLQAATRIAIPPVAGARTERANALPPGVELGPGILSIQFATPEELLSKLFLLAQNIAADFDEFRRISSGA